MVAVRFAVAVLLLFGQAQAQQVTDVSPATASAQEQAEKPTMIKGDRWVYTTHSERLISIENDKLLFEIKRADKAGSTAARELTLTSIPGEGGFDPPYRSLRFPLRVGDSWSHSYTFDQVKRHAKYQVVKREQLLIQGKSYDAFKVEGYDQREDRPRGMYVEVYYSPQVRGVIKVYRRDDTVEAIKRQDYELVQFEPGG